jgi:hypothetical protein
MALRDLSGYPDSMAAARSVGVQRMAGAGQQLGRRCGTIAAQRWRPLASPAVPLLTSFGPLQPAKNRPAMRCAIGFVSI